MSYGTTAQLIHDLNLAIAKLKDLYDPVFGQLAQINDKLDQLVEKDNSMIRRLDNLEAVVGTCVITVTWVDPDPEETIEGTYILKATASDDNGTHTIDRVEFYMGDTFLGNGTYNDPNWEKSINTKDYANANYTFKARAFCDKGNTKEATVEATIYNYIPPGGGGGSYGCTPTISILAPVEYSLIDAGIGFDVVVSVGDTRGHGIVSVTGAWTSGANGSFSSFSYHPENNTWKARTMIVMYTIKTKARFTVTATCEAGVSRGADRWVKNPEGWEPPPL